MRATRILGVILMFLWGGSILAQNLVQLGQFQLTNREYTITNQQPVTRVPYAKNTSSITAKRLPLDVINHLAPSSDAIAVNVLEDNGGWGPFAWNSGWWGNRTWSTPGPDDCCAMPLYYATANDPWYVVTGCDYGPPHNPGSWSPIGIPFHAPNQAKFTLSNNDNFLDIWDQDQNYLLEFYNYHVPDQSLPACSAKSPSNACQIHMHSCAMSKFDSDQDWGGVSATRSAGLAPFMGIIRLQELIQGQINHALYLGTDCVVGPPVFPDIGGYMAWECGTPPAPGAANRPSQASLFFLDYTDQQIQGMQIPQWQKTVLTAFAHYGGYVGETGLAGTTLNPYMESGEAYAYYGASNPFPQWAAQNGVTETCNANDCRYTFNFLDNVPWVTGPNCSNNCDLSHHMHIADPCVASGLANQPSNASTPPCVWPLTVKIAGKGSGSVTNSRGGPVVKTKATSYVGKQSAVILTAKPSGGSTFTGWSGSCTGSKNTCTLTVSQASNVTATFQ